MIHKNVILGIIPIYCLVAFHYELTMVGDFGSNIFSYKQDIAHQEIIVYAAGCRNRQMIDR